MPLSLDSFLNHANNVTEDRSLYVNSKGVQDTGRSGTVFTRAETFRKSTQAFLDAFRAEYGDRVGNVATRLLQHDLEAGKPLTAATVKNFVKYGNAEKDLKASYEAKCRDNIRSFLKDFTAEYGEHAGAIAEKLVQPDMEAGRALNAGTIQQLKEYGQAEKAMKQNYELTCQKRIADAQLILEDIQHDRQKAEHMLQGISQTPEGEFTDLEIHLFQLTVMACNDQLMEDAHLCEGDFTEQLILDIRQGAHPFLEKAVDLILLTTASPENDLMQNIIAQKNEEQWMDPTVPEAKIYESIEHDIELTIEDTLSILSLIEPTNSMAIDQDMLLNALAALPQIRASHPEGDITNAMIYHSVFVSGTTPTRVCPSDDELNHLAPDEMKALLQKANQDFLQNFHAEHLPEHSPFRGTGLNREAGLERAKNLNIPPQTIATLNSSQVTLQDLPLLPLDLPINSIPLPKLPETLSCFRYEAPLNGTKGMATAITQPTITIIDRKGVERQVNIGQIPGDDATLTEEQKDYNAGRQNAISNNIAYDLIKQCVNEKQGAMLMELLANDSRAPLVLLMQTFGDYGDISINSKFDYRITLLDDHKLQLDITTGQELIGFNGSGKLTYTLDADNQVNITDFSWQPPTSDQIKDALLTSNSTCALPAQIRQSAEAGKLDETATALFTKYATRFVTDALNQVAPLNELRQPATQVLPQLFPPQLNASNELKAIRQLAANPDFQKLNDAEQEKQLKILLEVIPQLEDSAEELFSAENVRQLYVEQAIGTLIKAQKAMTASGFAVTSQDLQAQIPPHGDNSLTELKNLIDMLNSAACSCRALLLPDTDRTAFFKAVELFQADTDYIAMNLFIENSGQITELHASGQLTRKNIWQLLFNAPLPNHIPAEPSSQALPVNLIDGQINDELMAIGMGNPALQAMESPEMPLPVLMVSLCSCMSFGLKKDVLYDFFKTGIVPQALTMEHCSEAGGICYSDAKNLKDPLSCMTNVDIAADQFYKDLCRMVDYEGTRPDGTPFTSENIIHMELPGLNEMPATLLHVKPNHLDPDIYAAPEGEDPRKALHEQLVDMVKNFCGEDHVLQSTATLQCMGQAGQLPVLGQFFFGEKEAGRHHNLNLSVTADDQRNLHVTYSSLPGYPVDYSWDIAISPDGTQRLTDFYMAPPKA